MAEKPAELAAEVELDFGKLLGFARIPTAGRNQAELTETMDAIHNKVGSPEGGCM
jgi:hypothetical protein